MKLRTVHVTRYVTPLREGGSLPAIVEADDSGLYVLKFRGAGQGPKALVAELLAGEIARALGLAVPEIVFAELDVELARTEPDAEVQALVRASGGRNFAIDYLPGAVTFDPLAAQPDAAFASAIVWFDAYIGNVDRSPRNTNMLMWHRRLWLIDHGAALTFHHAWGDASDRAERAVRAFAPIADHVLLKFATRLAEADALLAARLTADQLADIVALVPDDWLEDDPAFADPAAQRAAYLQHLVRRLESPRAFVEEAIRAHDAHL